MLFLSVATTRTPGGRRPPRARHVEVTDEWLTLELVDGQHLRMPTGWSPILAGAAPAERRGWRLVAGGFGISWPTLGEIVSLHPVLIDERSPAGEGTIPRLPGGRKLGDRTPGLVPDLLHTPWQG